MRYGRICKFMLTSCGQKSDALHNHFYMLIEITSCYQETNGGKIISLLKIV